MFYETLAAICKKKKTSPSAVVEAIGMSKSNVTEWKKGQYPRLDTVLKIAKVLGVSPNSLIKDIDPKEERK